MTQELVEALKKREQQKNLSTVEMAKRLGIAPSYLYMFYSGKRNPGRKLLGAVIREFPDLNPIVSVFLRAGLTIVKSDSQEPTSFREVETIQVQQTPLPTSEDA